ncbi:hypothetical protein AVEN_69228-1 [Araneus ventricosus]|uniref:Uncharacterized protein n=1 Tax=Araneus ventricosus TaxID=182803 RepID=A0A4Y2EST6_ARAVE|nr:hypothetical protein AVEN_69228-1 [Araneus ventricosus]
MTKEGGHKAKSSVWNIQNSSGAPKERLADTRLHWDQNYGNEPILSELCKSRYAPAHHGAQQGKAVTGSGILQPQHLP